MKPILFNTEMMPLTMKQLREMEGHPVLLRYPNGNSEFAIVDVRFVPELRAEFIRLVFQFGTKTVKEEDYGVFLTAYAYNPAHIDREAWNRPCLFCCEKSKGRKTLAFDSAGDAVTLEIDGNKAAIESDSMGFIVRFCPKCGRPLTEEAWAELEKRLRG